MKITVVSGGFDPIHSGHISYLESASLLGEKLIVCLNSDDWLIKKKGSFFMPFSERATILESISFVDKVIGFEDDDLGSCINGLKKITEMYKGAEIIFCNGGDRNSDNIPEMVCEGVSFEFEVGGSDKKNSSSWILNQWRYEHENRIWGQFYNLFQDSNVKVKELIVAPKKGMSFQRHFQRNEIWLVSKGACKVNFSTQDPTNSEEVILKKFDHFIVQVKQWHQIFNPYDSDCHIIEIQYGDATEETDIERLHFYEN